MSSNDCSTHGLSYMRPFSSNEAAHLGAASKRGIVRLVFGSVDSVGSNREVRIAQYLRIALVRMTQVRYAH